MTAVPLSDDELAALWVRYHEAAEAGSLAGRPEDDPDVTARELGRLLVEIEWRRAAAAELKEELFHAFIAGFKLSRQDFNAEHPFHDQALDIDTDTNIQQAFESSASRGLTYYIQYVTVLPAVPAGSSSLAERVRNGREADRALAQRVHAVVSADLATD